MATTDPPTPALGTLLLRRWRAALQVTQAHAADLVGLDFVEYNRFERGRAVPGMKRAAKISIGTGGRVPIESWTKPPPRRRGSAA